MNEGPAQSPAAARVNYLEDFEPGRVFHHHWGRTIGRDEAVAFATQHLLHEPALFNREYAHHLGYDDTPVTGSLVFAMVLGMSVEDLSESGGPFLGSDSLRNHAPVYPGDTLFGTSTVMSRRPSQSQPVYGVVEWETVGRNQHGTAVISFRRANLVRRRAQSAAAH